VLPFNSNLERVIDLTVFVWNNFLPNLPDFHIHENELEWLFDVYKNAVFFDSSLNEGGTINTRRQPQVVLDETPLLTHHHLVDRTLPPASSTLPPTHTSMHQNRLT